MEHVDNWNNLIPICADFICLHPCSIQTHRHRVGKKSWPFENNDSAIIIDFIIEFH